MASKKGEVVKPEVTLSRKDFFISYNKADLTWAEWIAWQLEEADYTTEIQAWDSQFGTNFIRWMNESSKNCKRTIAVLSRAYLKGRFSEDEWTSAFYKEKLLPVRIEDFEVEGLLGPIAYIDLVGLAENKAKEKLLKDIKQGRKKPQSAPAFPGKRKPRYPGTLPPYWNMPIQRNNYFTGREQVLEELHESLKAEQGAALTQVIKGLGGIGKTQIAVEYAYRHHTKYDIVWWVNAETEVTIQSAFELLTEKLGLPEMNAQEQQVKVNAARDYLNQNPDWLLIFDNVESGDTIYNYRPQLKHGHVIITTRDQNLQSGGKNISVDTWTDEEAQRFVKTRIDNASENDIIQLCNLLGNLPLAMEQAVAYIAASDLSIPDYIDLFNNNQQKYLGKSSIPKEEYNDTVASTWTLAIQKIQESMPAAVELLNMCAFMAPDNIPLGLIGKQADVLPESIKELLGDKGEMAEMRILFKRYSIVNIENETLSMHRLVQAVIRYGLAETQAKQSLGFVVEVMDKSFQGLNPQQDVKDWPIYQTLHPHILICGKYAQEQEVNLATVGYLYNNLAVYLHAIALYEQVESLYIEARDIVGKVHGKEHPDYATSLDNLAALYNSQGQYGKAEPLFIESRDIRAKALGKEHPDYATSLEQSGWVISRPRPVRQGGTTLPGSNQDF